jgi:hypothetical protein
MNETEAEKGKARRAIRILYLLMVVFIAAPFLVYLMVW